MPQLHERKENPVFICGSWITRKESGQQVTLTVLLFLCRWRHEPRMRIPLLITAVTMTIAEARRTWTKDERKK